MSIFIEIGQSLQFCDMAAILKKNGTSEMKFDSTTCSPHQKQHITIWITFLAIIPFLDIKWQSGKILKKIALKGQ